MSGCVFVYSVLIVAVHCSSCDFAIPFSVQVVVPGLELAIIKQGKKQSALRKNQDIEAVFVDFVDNL